VWLFGLAMGVANACALGEQAHQRPHASTAGDTAAVQQHQHGSEQADAFKLNCLDFCEKSSIAAAQLKSVGDSLTVLGLALPVAGTLPTTASTEHHAVGRLFVDSPRLPGGPPLRIVFQRLAL
jgi:hypothetical protein